MSLFQKSVLSKYIRQLDERLVSEAYDKFQEYFHDPDRQNNIKAAKEEQFQEGFLRELFVKILGYTINPEPDYNLTTEFKNENGPKKADGAILVDGKAIGVIELKGTDTKDLDKINQQAFSYKNQQSKCLYVITSNFEKLRLFINNAVDHEEFNLFELNEDEFKILWLCLQKDNLLRAIPLRIKEESLLEEEKVTMRLYADYSTFKRELWEDMVKRNPDHDELLLFKKSQKLLDRFLFILFSEDKGLLPPNSISIIIEDWMKLKELDEYRPLYDRFKKYFTYMNKGFKGKKYEIHAYNGGLFFEDEVLESIVIDDELLRNYMIKLTEYDYDSEVDVNIMGHIFEHSLSEIENVRSQLEGKEVDKNKTKRKKEGVYYTPKYITKYIVDNTVGKLCVEKKEELEITEERFTEARRRTKKGIKDLEDYRKWLLELTICDPACGSGAFLNQALEYLINEHTWLDEMIAEYHGSSIVFQDVEKHILENNLYGVDINEESVEIAKLSLWLRTAQQGRVLTTLSENIKCGNSLIDDPVVAANKAFDWKVEFPKVFTKGGFDVVIGNPPYVRVQNLEHDEIDWYKEHFEVAHKRIDISIMFIELGSKILSNNGLLAYITSNQFLNSEYGRKCRQLLLRDYKIEKIVDFGDLPIFEDALTYVSIFNLRKNKPGDFFVYKVRNMDTAITGDYRNPIKVKHSSLNDEIWILKDKKQEKILKQLQQLPHLDSIASCNYGIVTGNDSVFILTNDFIAEHKIERGILLPLIRANNCERYKEVGNDLYVIYPYELENRKTKLINETVFKSKHPIAYAYLEQHRNELMIRKDSRKTFEEREDWYALTRFGRIDMFNELKIVFPGETKNNKFGIDKNKAGYSGARVFSITLDKGAPKQIDVYGLLGIMNSTLIEYYLHSIAPLKQGGYYSYSSTVVNKAPIKQGDQLSLISSLSKEAIEAVTKLESLRNKLNSYLVEHIPSAVASKKLKKWDKLAFIEFMKEVNIILKKAGEVKLTMSEEIEWMEVFNDYIKHVQGLQTEIDKIDKEIDQMVYELYGLTKEEIEIVEQSI